MASGHINHDHALGGNGWDIGRNDVETAILIDIQLPYFNLWCDVGVFRIMKVDELAQWGPTVSNNSTKNVTSVRKIRVFCQPHSTVKPQAQAQAQPMGSRQ